MKHTILFLMLGALSLAATAQDPAESITVQGHKPQAAPRYHMYADEFAEFKGGYELSNGKTLYLLTVGTLMYAQVDDQRRQRIVATGPHSFIALEPAQPMSMRIERDANGNAGGELSYVDEARTAMAGAPPSPVRMALGSARRAVE
ncbi:MAG: hypothetical protein V4508_13755 [Pseudomonadota bacterium]